MRRADDFVQAFYAEALGSPALEYMLISNATRLALATGLYLIAPQSNKLTPEEAVSRQQLWWVLYAYEKHVAFISGRPSVSNFGSTIVLMSLT